MAGLTEIEDVVDGDISHKAHETMEGLSEIEDVVDGDIKHMRQWKDLLRSRMLSMVTKST